jgi:hypothetical protein
VELVGSTSEVGTPVIVDWLPVGFVMAAVANGSAVYNERDVLGTKYVLSPRGVAIDSNHFLFRLSMIASILVGGIEVSIPIEGTSAGLDGDGTRFHMADGSS